MIAQAKRYSLNLANLANKSFKWVSLMLNGVSMRSVCIPWPRLKTFPWTCHAEKRFDFGHFTDSFSLALKGKTTLKTNGWMMDVWINQHHVYVAHLIVEVLWIICSPGLGPCEGLQTPHFPPLESLAEYDLVKNMALFSRWRAFERLDAKIWLMTPQTKTFDPYQSYQCPPTTFGVFGSLLVINKPAARNTGS